MTKFNQQLRIYSSMYDDFAMRICRRRTTIKRWWSCILCLLTLSPARALPTCYWTPQVRLRTNIWIKYINNNLHNLRWVKVGNFLHFITLSFSFFSSTILNYAASSSLSENSYEISLANYGGGFGISTFLYESIDG